MYPPEVSEPAPTIDEEPFVRLAEEWAQIQAQVASLSASSRPLEQRAKDLKAQLAQRMGREGLAYVGEYEIRRTVTTVTPEPYTRHDVRLKARERGPKKARVEEVPASELYAIPDVDRLVAYLAERAEGETQSALAKLCAPGVLEAAEADGRLEAVRKGKGVRWFARVEATP
jgi:hypothetical protein